MKEIKPDALCPMPDDFMPNIKKQISSHLLSNPDYESLRVELSEEVGEEYQFSMRKSIGNYYLFIVEFENYFSSCLHSLCVFLVDYILKDPAEMSRLKINSIPQPYPQK